MAAAALLLSGALLAADPYIASVEEWRRQREQRLRADDGWLTVSGLFWLKEGENSFGTDPACDIVLPPGSAPPKAGVFEHRQGRTVLRWASGAPPLPIEPDKTIVPLGDLSFQIIHRGSRYGVRLRDKNSRFRKEFTGLAWYPVDPAWRVTARFVPHEAPRRLRVGSTIGEPQEFESPGWLDFELKGRKLRLEPAAEGRQLFIIFKDLTSGKTTYPAGRFLYADWPQDGQVTLDFNKAYNPPCAFTPYTTCPLPPQQNHLPVAIKAGEKMYQAPQAASASRPPSSMPRLVFAVHGFPGTDRCCH
jgi:uncharacterized protein (DUF1684 family)